MSSPKADPKGKLFLVNASQDFTKGDPYLPDDSIRRIVEMFQNWKEQDKFSKIVMNKKQWFRCWERLARAPSFTSS